MPIRLPAEWEKQDYIMLVFPSPHSDWEHSIYHIQKSYISLIKNIMQYQKCVVACKDISRLHKVLPKSKNIKLLQIETDDSWVRDFGAISIFQDEKLKILNFKFNAWGNKFPHAKDNLFNTKLKDINFFKAPIKDMNFILEGGSIDTNGKGVLLTTQNCIFNQNRNPKFSKKQILDILKNSLGVQHIITLQNGSLVGDDTDSHIDMLARFIDKESIAYVKCYDKLDKNYNSLNKMEEELKKTKFHLVPLPLPNPKFFLQERLPATYINFIFINSALIVPTYKDKNDTIALNILRNSLPDRDIIGVDASIFIRERGSLHCATMNYFKGTK